MLQTIKKLAPISKAPISKVPISKVPISKAPIIINAGTVQLNNKEYMNKNVNIYKSPEWLYCNVLIHNTCYKRIYAEELREGQAHSLKMYKYNTLPSLLYDDGIVYQRDAWFAFKLEFILNGYHNQERVENETIINTSKKCFYEINMNKINYGINPDKNNIFSPLCI